MSPLTYLNAKQLRALDATAATIGLSTEQLMERAGYELAKHISGLVDAHAHILFLCGPGNNGGDGLSACRHLHNLGFHVTALLATEMKSPEAERNMKILDRLSIPLHKWNDEFSFSPYDVLVDCVLGYSQKKEVEGNMAELIKQASKAQKQVIACDLPTGMHADSGERFSLHLQAQHTISLVAPKLGFSNRDAQRLCGKILIVGIGIPSLAYEQLGLAEGEFLVEGSVELNEHISSSKS